MSDVLIQAALSMERAGNLGEAARLYREILEHHPGHFQAVYSLANLEFVAGHYESAERLFAEAAAINPHAADVQFAHGCALQRMGQNEAAVAVFDKAIALDRRHVDALVNRAVALVAVRRLKDSADSFRQALALQPRRAELWCAHGDALAAAGELDQALSSYDKAIALRPNYPEAWNNRGAAYFSLKRYEESVASYDALLRMTRPDPALFANRGIALTQLKRHGEALADYDRALTLDPRNANLLYHRGVALYGLRRFEEALTALDASLSVLPDAVDPLLMRGIVLAELGRLNEALVCDTRAIALSPDNVRGYVNRQNALFLLKRYEESADDCERALALNPGLVSLRGDLVYRRLYCCDWRRLPEEQAAVATALAEGKRAVQPFVNIALPGTAETQARAAKLWSENEIERGEPLWRGERYRHSRIRLAYISGDLNDHPVSQLMAGVFENHDRARFETTAISFGDDDNSALRRRVMGAFDQFLDVRGETDAEIAALMRRSEIDIAVDLMGYTGRCRPGICARRPAPAQVNYLGYPGTLAADFMDYILADRTVIPEAERRSYAEQVVWLPDSYLPVDSKRIVGPPPTRSETGLPGAAFIFASFNTSYKFAPEMFSVWMRLLQAVPGSVLWLPANNHTAVFNFRQEVAARGVEPERLIFAPFVPSAEAHLARLSLADLFLDTLPCNAHSTAADALQAGVPVLTCKGTSFPGRVAASLLFAARLPELVANSLVEYESQALKLATQRDMLQAMRRRLADARASAPLFDTVRMTRALEAAYTQMHARVQSGQGAAHFAVEPP